MAATGFRNENLLLWNSHPPLLLVLPGRGF
jgi:hypothetical protein